jgi:hypothetical protein
MGIQDVDVGSASVALLAMQWESEEVKQRQRGNQAADS